MPFPSVTKHGIEKNFEQVLNSLFERLKPYLGLPDDAGNIYGWTLGDDLAALETMVAQSADKLWTAAIDEDGNSRAALLEARIATLELERARLTEQLSALSLLPAAR